MQELRFLLKIPSLDIDIFLYEINSTENDYVRCIQFLITLFFYLKVNYQLV